MADYAALVWTAPGFKKPSYTDDSVVLTNTVKTNGAADLTLTPAGNNIIISGGKTLQTSAIDTAAAGGMTVGGTNATTIDIDGSGAVSVNSSGGAINIGNDDIDQAVNIGTDGERAVTVGSSNGAAALSLVAGTGEVDITGGGALDINMTAGMTLDCTTIALTPTSTYTLNATGAVTVDSGAAIDINSSAAAINIGNDDIDQAVNIGTDGERTVTVGSSNGAAALNLKAGTGEVDITGGGALDVNMTAGVTVDCTTMGLTPTSTFDLQATGAVTIDSSGGTIGIGTDANAQAINIGTGAAARTITVGNNTGASALNLVAGTGEIDVTGGGALDINMTAGATLDCTTVLITPTSTFGVNATGALDLDSVAAVSINSSGAAINIGNDDVDQAVNIATDGERTVTVGSSNGAAALNLVSGTGEIDITGGGALDINMTAGMTLDCTTVLVTPTSTFGVNATGAIDLDSAAAVSINSSGGVINIGNDDIDQDINIGTTGERTITIGNEVNTDVSIKSANGTEITGDLVVTGNYTVQGDVFIDEATHNLYTDNHLYLNNAYTTAVAETFGLVGNRLPTATTDTVAATGFTAGVNGVSNPTVHTTGAATFAQNDIIQINGANNAANNGLFEVHAHAANLLTIRGIGTVTTVEDFTQNQFTTDTTVAGSIYKINVNIFRCGTDGNWEVGGGSTTGISFSDIGVGNPPLATVLATGNTSGANNIIMADNQYVYLGTDSDASIRYSTANTQLEILCEGGGDNGIYFGQSQLKVADDTTIVLGTNDDAYMSYDESGNDDFEIRCSGAGGISVDATVGILSLDGNGGVNIIGNNAEVDITTTGTLDLNSAACTLDCSTLDINGSGAINIDSSGGAIGVGTDAVAQNINIGTGAAARTITIGNNTDATQIALETGSGGLQIDADGNSAAAVAGTFDLDATGAIGIESSGAAISIGADDIDQAVNVGTDGERTVTVGSANGAAALNLKAGTGEIDITGGGALDINMTAGMTLDCTTVAITPTSTYTLNATGAVTVDSGAAIEINSSAGAINIGNDDIDQNVNIGTDGERTVTVGSSNGAAALNLVAGTGEIDITGGGALDINMTAGMTLDCTTIAITPTSTFDLQATGAITIDSSGGAIGIGTDADAQAINIGTGAAARTITVGNVTGATAIDINSGTGGVTIDCVATADIAITAADNAASDILFAAHGSASIPFNADGADSDLVGFTATSVIGALNELKASVPESDQVVSDYDTTACAAGDPVYISGNKAASPGDADAAASSRIIGICKTVGAVGTGEVVVKGSVTVSFAAGGAPPAAGTPLYLSTTAGRVSATAPSGIGDTVILLGHLKDNSTLTHNPVEDGDPALMELVIGDGVLIGD